MDAVRELEAHAVGVREDEADAVSLRVRLGVRVARPLEDAEGGTVDEGVVLVLEEAQRDAEGVAQGQGLGLVEAEVEGLLEAEGHCVGVRVAEVQEEGELERDSVPVSEERGETEVEREGEGVEDGQPVGVEEVLWHWLAERECVGERLCDTVTVKVPTFEVAMGVKVTDLQPVVEAEREGEVDEEGHWEEDRDVVDVRQPLCESVGDFDWEGLTDAELRTLAVRVAEPHRVVEREMLGVVVVEGEVDAACERLRVRVTEGVRERDLVMEALAEREEMRLTLRVAEPHLVVEREMLGVVVVEGEVDAACERLRVRVTEGVRERDLVMEALAEREEMRLTLRVAEPQRVVEREMLGVVEVEGQSEGDGDRETDLLPLRVTVRDFVCEGLLLVEKAGEGLRLRDTHWLPERVRVGEREGVLEAQEEAAPEGEGDGVRDMQPMKIAKPSLPLLVAPTLPMV